MRRGKVAGLGILLEVMRLRFSSVLLVVAAACGGGNVAEDPLTATPQSSLQATVERANTMASNVVGEQETALGWNVDSSGGTVRWHECAAIDRCGPTERERPSSDVLALAKAGSARLADGRLVEVVRLTLKARPRSVTPPRDWR
jgi:hypothetical protein